MSVQHLSDEAVAAFADGVLRGHARDRASRHLAGCSECARAVRVQREAVLALRAAPAPQLPSGLLDRLRSVPITTPIRVAPAALSADGAPLFGGFAPMAAAAFVGSSAPAPAASPTPASANPAPFGPTEHQPAESDANASLHHRHRLRRVPPVLLTAAAVAAAGVFAVASSDGATAAGPSARDGGSSSVGPVNQLSAFDARAHRGLLSYRQP